MMEIFFKHNPNGLIAHLITQGAHLPLGFHRSILDKPPEGDLIDQPIVDAILRP